MNNNNYVEMLEQPLNMTCLHLQLIMSEMKATNYIRRNLIFEIDATWIGAYMHFP